jgi:ribokinase
VGGRVCVVGSANLDLVVGVDRLPAPGETVLGHEFAEHPGGKGLNQAVAAARAGAAVAFVGAVGVDDAGERLRQVMAAEGIDTRAVATVEVPTGRAVIGVDAEGENSIVVVPGANGCLGADLSPVALEVLAAADVVLAQLEIPMAVVEAALSAAPQAVTILNPAPAGSIPMSVLRRCTVVVPNEHELGLLGGVEALRAGGVPTVVVTQGRRGASLHDDRYGVEHRVEPFTVTAVDTTAAGDAFCGVLAARLAEGADLLEALRWAAAAGALATTTAGAVASLPSRSEVARLLSAGT